MNKNKNSCVRPIGATDHRGWFTFKTLAAAFGALTVTSTVGSAAFSENFQDDIVGLPPTPFWTISGANGTTATGNVAVEGANNFLALRDFTSDSNVTAYRSDSGGGLFETAGSLQFDIRFNQGIDSYFTISLPASKTGVCGSCFEPIILDFFHNAHNTNTPLLFRAWGNGAGYPPADPNAFALITSDFPIGSWETIRVEFNSSGGLPRGTYSVSWNGITNDYMYRNQGDLIYGPAPLAIDRLYIATSGMTTSIDIDNIQFIPEPSGLLLCSCGVLALFAIRRRSPKIGS